MTAVRCSVCRQWSPTMKLLKSHYFARHSKTQLVRKLLKAVVLQLRDYKSRRKLRGTANTFAAAEESPSYLKTETLYMNDEIRPVVIKRDVVDNTKKKIEENRQEYVEIDGEFTLIKTEPAWEYSTKEGVVKLEPLADTASEASIQLKPRRKRTKTNKLKNYRIDKTLAAHAPASLNEKTGEFYICYCADSSKTNEILKVYQKDDLQNLASDTESCSDVGKTTPTHKYYCHSCGNGYATKNKLTQHLKMHEQVCKLCIQTFSSPEVYKEHMKKHLMKIYVCHLCKKEFAHKTMLLDHLDAHMEDEVYDNVFGLEDDYNMNLNSNDSFSSGYSTSNSFACNVYDPSVGYNQWCGFAHNDNWETNYFNYFQYNKIFCYICCAEVVSLSFEEHFRQVHF